MPRTHSTTRHKRRHNPLAEDYSPASPYQQKAAKKRRPESEDDLAQDAFIDAKSSQKILKAGRDLVEEDEAETLSILPRPNFSLQSRQDLKVDHEHNDGQFNEDEENGDAWSDEEDAAMEEVDIDPSDRAVFDLFHPAQDPDPALLFDPKPVADNARVTGNGTANLSELILEKIAEHEALLEAAEGTEGDVRINSIQKPPDEVLDPKVVEVYTLVGQLLSRYRSGPLPKPFKILPSLQTSEIPQLVALTQPELWTPHAVYAATRLFVSSKPAVAQPFVNSILLPRVRDDIQEYKTGKTKQLNDHLENAIKKSLYRPACFFKGFLFPLLEEGTCTVRESEIISSIVVKSSIPVLHSAAALLRLCDIAAEHFTTTKEDGGGAATNIFIRVLLQKKYALPYKVIDALVFHFLRFKALNVVDDNELATKGTQNHNRARGGQPTHKLPVRWHECLLAFAQRYRNDITEDQREALLDLVAAVGHKGKGSMGNEVHRELLAGRGRGVPIEPEVEPDGDDTMLDA